MVRLTYSGRCVGRQGEASEQGKQFFFEKKNQKTFALVGCALLRRVVSAVRGSARKSFLLLFLDKEGACFFSISRLVSDSIARAGWLVTADSGGVRLRLPAR